MTIRIRVIYDRDEEISLAWQIYGEIADKIVEGKYTHIHVSEDRKILRNRHLQGEVKVW